MGCGVHRPGTGPCSQCTGTRGLCPGGRVLGAPKGSGVLDSGSGAQRGSTPKGGAQAPEPGDPDPISAAPAAAKQRAGGLSKQQSATGGETLQRNTWKPHVGLQGPLRPGTLHALLSGHPLVCECPLSHVAPQHPPKAGPLQAGASLGTFSSPSCRPPGSPPGSAFLTVLGAHGQASLMSTCPSPLGVSSRSSGPHLTPGTVCNNLPWALSPPALWLSLAAPSSQ